MCDPFFLFSGKDSACCCIILVFKILNLAMSALYLNPEQIASSQGVLYEKSQTVNALSRRVAQLTSLVKSHERSLIQAPSYYRAPRELILPMGTPWYKIDPQKLKAAQEHRQQWLKEYEAPLKGQLGAAQEELAQVQKTLQIAQGELAEIRAKVEFQGRPLNQAF
jgi:hypothetical protein